MIFKPSKELRKKYHLPKTKIETDSYIAVQLLEYKKLLNEKSIKFMAEALEGSFSFSILDSSDTNSYIEDLKSVAAFEGICPDEIDYLATNGFSPEEIEEYIYCYE